MSIHTPDPAANYRFIARLPDGRSLVSCHAQNAVLIVAESGELDGKVEVEFSRPEGIAVNSKGQVLVADRYHHCIHILDERLAHQRSIVTDHQLPGRLNQPVGIAISASDDRIWVADNENHRVLVLSAKGEYLATLGNGYGRAPGQLFCPCGIALFDHPIHGELVIVSEWGGGRVQVFSVTTGGVFAIFGGVEHAHHVAVDSKGTIFVSEYSARRIRRFSLDGESCDACDGESAVSLVAGRDGLAMVVTQACVVSSAGVGESKRKKRKRFYRRLVGA